MSVLLKDIIKNCELSVRKDANGVHISAKGALAVIAAAAIIIFLAVHLLGN